MVEAAFVSCLRLHAYEFDSIPECEKVCRLEHYIFHCMHWYLDKHTNQAARWLLQQYVKSAVEGDFGLERKGRTGSLAGVKMCDLY